MRAWLIGVLGVLGVFGLWGCAAGVKAPPLPDAAMAASSGVCLSTLREGHEVYLTQCGSCHELFQPDSVEASDWRLVVPGMCWNAGLTREDEALVLKYVLAAKKP